jgi:hypothetical protein
MKIKLNDKEYFNIELDDEIDLDELNGILFRLNNVSKIFSKDVFKISKHSDNSNNNHNTDNNLTATGRPKIKYKRKNEHNFRNPVNTKEKTIELLKLHYYGTDEEKEKFIKNINFYSDWTIFSKRFFNLRKKFNIQPSEIGLNSYPGKGHIINKENHMIKNYEYKYNPDIFKQEQTIQE